MRVYYLFWFYESLLFILDFDVPYGYAVVFTAPQQFHAPSVSRVAVLDD